MMRFTNVCMAFCTSVLLIAPLSAQYQKATSSRLDIHFRVFGEGEPLLIIGGGPGDNSDRYLSLCDLLAAGCQCIMPDQRGTGKSVPAVLDSTTVTIDLTLQDFEAVRKELGLKKWHVLGFSYGGFLASVYAHFYPESVSSLVLLGSMGLNRDAFGHFRDNIQSRMNATDKAKYQFWSDSERYARNPAHALAEIVRAMIPGYFYSREKSLLVSEAIQDTDFDIHGMGALIWADVRTRSLDLETMKPAYTGSVLVLHGRQDPLGEAVPLGLADYYDHSNLKFIEKAGHYSWIEQPEIVKEQIHAFMLTEVR